MSRKYINHASIWLLLINKILKAFLAISLVIFSFVGQWPGVLVEGSPTTIVEEKTLLNTTNNQPATTNPLLAAFVAINNPTLPPKKMEIIVTGYSSTPEETDDTPFITASGKVVEEGIIAANFLKFGTKVRFPEIFGDRIFIVEDRMHQKFNEGRVDIWFPTKLQALEFGIKKTIMEIMEEPPSE